MLGGLLSHLNKALVGEIHVWLARLDLRPIERKRLVAFLSPDERSRADRFRFAKDKNRFIAGRAFLRLVLGQYLDMEPGALRFTYNEFGKPERAGSFGPDNPGFNLSHSGDVALLAIAEGRRVGIDIERVREDVTPEQIAGTFFSDVEQSILEAMPATRRMEVFFQFWTRKEAFVKGTGRGFSFPPDQADVSGLGDEAWSAISFMGGSEEKIGAWYVRDLSVVGGYAAALAVEEETGPVIFKEVDLAHF